MEWSDLDISFYQITNKDLSWSSGSNKITKIETLFIKLENKSVASSGVPTSHLEAFQKYLRPLWNVSYFLTLKIQNFENIQHLFFRGKEAMYKFEIRYLYNLFMETRKLIKCCNIQILGKYICKMKGYQNKIPKTSIVNPRYTVF